MKEAEEYAQDMAMYYESAHGSIPSQFEKYLCKAVEYGYNKANEWHYVKDGDLPKPTTPVLVILESGVPYVSWISSDKGWWFCTNYYTGEDKVIAWKEIVLPKESE